MQDRFKFRAALKTDKFTILVEPFYILDSCYFIDINKAEVEFECKHPDECFWDFVEEIKKQDYIQEISVDSDLIITKDFTNLMQSTGLKDKNGKLIYEGDIVEVINCRGAKAVVKFNPELVKFELKGDKFSPSALQHIRRDYFEVIGNIYENPELLKKQ